MTDNQISAEQTKTSPQIHASHIDIPAVNVQSTTETNSDEIPGSFTKDPHQAQELKEILENFDPLTISAGKEESENKGSGKKSSFERANNSEFIASELDQTTIDKDGNGSVKPTTNKTGELKPEQRLEENSTEKNGNKGHISGIQTELRETDNTSTCQVRSSDQHNEQIDQYGHSTDSARASNPSDPLKHELSVLPESSAPNSDSTTIDKPHLTKFPSEKSIHSIPKDEDIDQPFDFQRFLDLLRHKSADPIARYVKSFLNEFNKRPWTITEQMKIIGDFKIFISEKMAICPPFNTLSEHDMINATEGMEKLIMNRLYNKVFSPEIPIQIRSGGHEEDVIRDNVLEEKLHIWNWIQGRHLDIGDRFLRNGNSFVKLASDELTKMNHYRAPRDKVICILNCCKVIFGLLRQTNNEESADGFLPILIFVIIKAQPKDLISNINYIQRFRDADMLAGEAGYYMSSLIGAVSFIEQLDRSQLSITDEEFEQNVELSVQHIVAPIKAQEATSENHREINEMRYLSSENAGLHPPITPKRASSPNDEVDSTGNRTSVDNPTSGESQTSGENPTSGESQTSGTSVGLNASQVLYSSAGLFTAPFRSLSKLFESDPSEADSSKMDKRGVLVPEELAARQVSAEEAEARRIHQQEFENVAETLKQMFPTLDKDIIEDVLRSKDSRVGAAVDACLTLVEG